VQSLVPVAVRAVASFQLNQALLARENRLRSADDFRNTMKLGRKAVTDHMVVYLNNLNNQDPFKLGLVVGKTAGNAVQRNLVKRRMRAAIQKRLEIFGSGEALVLRALPGLVDLSWEDFCAELDSNITRVKRTVN